MFTKKFPKVSNQFSCEKCHYICYKQSLWNKHISTSKHKNVYQDVDQKVSGIFSCDCGKSYSYKQSLCVHKKKCINQKSLENNFHDLSNNNVSDLSNNNVLIFELLKSNNEFKELLVEQNKQILELVKETGFASANNININSHNTTNNKFNLNLFLNEQCKDAMNISDFIKSLEISFEDFENVGTLGYAEGISKIIINNLKNTEIEKRPMHCSDLKRETMYIKDKDIWENDKEKTLFVSAIKGVAHKNFMKSVDWKKENPDYCDSSSKTMDKYNKILYETSGPISKEEKEKEYNKILRRVAKEVMIQK